MKVKVCDFGLSQCLEHGKKAKDDVSAKGTPLWMAPEVMQFQAFNEKADIYSYGIVLWEFLTRSPPFPHHNNYKRFKESVCNGERPAIPADCEPSLQSLIEACWAANPDDRPAFEQIIQALEKVIVDVAIKDPLGRDFWKAHFLGMEEVTWRIFARRFDSFLDLPDDDALPTADMERVNLNIRWLKAVLAPSNTVSLEQFGALLESIGPITPPDSTPINRTVLDNLRELMEQEWFHGNLETRVVTERLSTKEAGTYLVRFSSIPGCFTISYIMDGVVNHKRIHHSLGSPYVIDNHSYPSLSALVKDLGLVHVCPKPKAEDGGYTLAGDLPHTRA